MAEMKSPRSERTIFPRHYKRPLRGEALAQAKAAERQRMAYDPTYMPAEEARALPAEIAARPDVANRIRYSQPDWPENNASATVALGPLLPGAGETIEDRTVDTASVFGGSRVQADPGASEV